MKQVIQSSSKIFKKLKEIIKSGAIKFQVNIYRPYHTINGKEICYPPRRAGLERRANSSTRPERRIRPKLADAADSFCQAGLRMFAALACCLLGRWRSTRPGVWAGVLWSVPTIRPYG
jgi:hypothetical protein